MLIGATLALGAALASVVATPSSAWAMPAGCSGTEGWGDWGYINLGNGAQLPIWRAGACQWLDPGESWYFGNARMTMQTDGNLVIYDRQNRNRWSTRTSGSGATQALFQTDGNLVLYTAGYARNVWSTRTGGDCSTRGGAFLALQEDSNLVIRCATVGWPAVWASGTHRI